MKRTNIKRAEARTQGLNRYFTGEPCKHGHVAERFVSNGTCLECAQESKNKRHEANRDYHRAYREANWATPEYISSTLLRSTRGRALKLNLPFNLDADWIRERIVAGHCEVTGIKFSLDRGESLSMHIHPVRPSVDRVDSLGGYTKDNCKMVICAWNSFKQEMPEPLARMLVKQIARVLSEKSEEERR